MLSKNLSIAYVLRRLGSALSCGLRQGWVALCRLAKTQLRFAWLSLIVLVVLGLVLLPFAGLLREDLQAFAFPILFLGFWRLPKDPAFRVPAPLMILVLALWMGATLHVRGVTPGEKDFSEIIFARLQTDEQGLAARGLFQRYTQIARTYHLLDGRLVHRGVGSNGTAGEWLSEFHPKSPFLVRGQPDWMEVVFNPSLQLGSDDGGKTTSVTVDWSDQEFKIGYLPDVLKVPGEPRELGLHFLAWLAQSLRWQYDELAPGSKNIAEHTVALRRDSLVQITTLNGVWLSNSPFGLGHYLLGTFDLLEAIDQGGVADELYKSALERFQRAAGLVRIHDDPDLYALIFNNAAVALFAAAKGPEDLYKARQWLRISLGVAELDGQVPFGSKLAFENLLQFERSVRIVE